MQLWSIQIGERSAVREDNRGIQQVHVAPLLALHRRRAVTLADRNLAQSVIRWLRPRFPDAELRPFPGGPEDCLVIEDESDARELVQAYGLGPRAVPDTAAGARLLEWAGQSGDPLALPAEVTDARGDEQLLPALQQQMAAGQVNPARAYALIGALGQPRGLDFLAWAINAEDDFEFGAKYGFATRDQTLNGVRALAPEVAVDFVRRAMWGRDHLYPWPVVEACVERLVRLGEAGLAALRELKQGHRLESHIDRWIEQQLRRHARQSEGPA